MDIFLKKNYQYYNSNVLRTFFFLECNFFIYGNPSLRNYINYDNFRIIGNLSEYFV